MAGASWRAFSSGSRPYQGNVGDEYDAWTNEGILEHYWGEHIHLGYYTRAEQGQKGGAFRKDFKGAKADFTDEMLKFSLARAPRRILDVGCGFGGSSRMLARRFPEAEVLGVTLSPAQVRRGKELAAEQGLTNVDFVVQDALKLSEAFEGGEFDLVWACESGEHMPDKQLYVEEMARMLAPGGNLVVACWCQREETAAAPFSEEEREELRFLCEEWAHPYFISIQEFERLMAGAGLEGIRGDDWTYPTLPSWRHSVWVGVEDPWPVVKAGPRIWYKTTREIVTLERMHRAFESGLMQYGLIRAQRPLGAATSAPGPAGGRGQAQSWIAAWRERTQARGGSGADASPPAAAAAAATDGVEGARAWIAAWRERSQEATSDAPLKFKGSAEGLADQRRYDW